MCTSAAKNRHSSWTCHIPLREALAEAIESLWFAGHTMVIDTHALSGWRKIKIQRGSQSWDIGNRCQGQTIAFA